MKCVSFNVRDSLPNNSGMDDTAAVSGFGHIHVINDN